MCYYDSWFEENWCEEPREEETALIEAIKESVRQDIKQEMERLRKEQKTQTNADKIRSMTDEELADFLDKCEGKGYQDSSITPINEDGYHMDMLDWLKRPAKEE